MLHPVMMLACPLALWGSPSTPMRGSVGTEVARVCSVRALFLHPALPVGQPRESGQMRHAEWVNLGSSSPMPIPFDEDQQDTHLAHP
jgi:hypothetical protein